MEAVLLIAALAGDPLAVLLAAAARGGIAGSASADDRFDMTPNAGIPSHNQEPHDRVSMQACVSRGWRTSRTCEAIHSLRQIDPLSFGH